MEKSSIIIIIIPSPNGMKSSVSDTPVILN